MDIPSIITAVATAVIAIYSWKTHQLAKQTEKLALSLTAGILCTVAPGESKIGASLLKAQIEELMKVMERNDWEGGE